MTTILIADDNSDLLEMLAIQLRQHGFSTLTATNGHEVLELVKCSPPNLIIMDLNMPELDGWEATSQLKLDPALRDIPIIALTGYSLPGDRARALSAGCDSFHAKPVELMVILKDIENFAGGHQYPNPA